MIINSIGDCWYIAVKSLWLFYHLEKAWLVSPSYLLGENNTETF
jgi:hypothetical protein